MRPLQPGRQMLRALAALLLVLAATASRAGSASYAVSLGGDAIEATWHWPEGRAPTGLVLLQHGFMRRCANLRTLAAAMADAGHWVLCLNADMAGGNPLLAAALARAVNGGELRAPDGGPLPRRVVLAGHSAGAAFAVAVAAALEGLEPGRVQRLLLLDPVGLRAPVLAPVPTPLLAVLAPPLPCNAMQQALPALQGSPHARIVQLEGGTHVDAEGDDSDGLARAACAPGAPRPENVARLRELALRWLEPGPTQVR
jgi:alpha-beta hydrolase superfamily lysophospholipase